MDRYRTTDRRDSGNRGSNSTDFRNHQGYIQLLAGMCHQHRDCIHLTDIYLHIIRTVKERPDGIRRNGEKGDTLAETCQGSLHHPAVVFPPYFDDDVYLQSVLVSTVGQGTISKRTRT